MNRTNILMLLSMMLALSVLVYPYSPYLGSGSVEPLYMIPDVLLFGVLLCAFVFVSLIRILLSRDGLNLVVMMLLVTVFLGYWTKAGSARYTDELFSLAHSAFLVQDGHITTSASYLTYFSFPGTFLVGAALTEVIGSGIGIGARFILTYWVIAAFALSLFLLYRVFLHDERVTCFAVFLTILGNLELSRISYFHPDLVNYLLATTLLLLSRSSLTRVRLTTMVLILLAMVVSYLPATLWIMTIFVFYVLLGRQGYTKVLMMGGVALSTFLVFYAFTITGYLLSGLELSFANFSPFYIFRGSVSSGISPLPIWANAVQLSWIVITYALGSVAVLYLLYKRFQLDKSALRLMAAGYGGTVLFSVIATIAYPGGAEFARFLMYAPIFTIPALVLVSKQFADSARHDVMVNPGILLLILLLSLSLITPPTFLVYNKQISSQYVHPEAYQAYHWLSGTSSGLTVWTSYSISWEMQFFMPTTNYVTQSALETSVGANSSLIDILSLVRQYVHSPSSSIFVYSPRIPNDYRSVFGIPTSSGTWRTISSALETTNRAYDNGYVCVYSI